MQGGTGLEVGETVGACVFEEGEAERRVRAAPEDVAEWGAGVEARAGEMGGESEGRGAAGQLRNSSGTVEGAERAV